MNIQCTLYHQPQSFVNIPEYTISAAPVPCEYPRVHNISSLGTLLISSIHYIITLSTLWISEGTQYQQPQYLVNIPGYTTSSASVPCEYPRVCYIISLSTLWISQCTLYHQPQYLVNITLYHQPRYPVNIPVYIISSPSVPCEYPRLTISLASVPCEYPSVHNITSPSTLWISQCTLYHHPQCLVNSTAYTISASPVPYEYSRVHYIISLSTLWISQGTQYHQPHNTLWIS